MISNRPTSAAELQRRAAARAGHPGLLAKDGASRGNLFTGGADQLALVLSVAGRRGKRNRSRAGYFAYFSDPANATRTAGSFVAEVCREIGQSARAKLRRERPRVRRGGFYPFIRAFATVVERDVVVAAVIGDMLAGRSAVYADLVAYDEVAHHSGPYSRDTHQVLRRLDRSIKLIAKAARHAPRDYRFMLLSDHGQTPGETFAAQYGLTLEDLVRAGCGLPVPRHAERTRSGAAARVALHRPEKAHEHEQAPADAPPARPGPDRHHPRTATPGPGPLLRPRRPDHPPPDHWPRSPPPPPPSRLPPPPPPSRSAGGTGPLVLGSGNLGLISFPDVPHRMTREEIDHRHPALLHALAEHPGIGFLLVRSAVHGPVVLGAHGSEHHLATGHVVGASPLAPFGPGAAAAVLRTDGFPHVADIMVNSAYDPGTGEVHAFEDQIGSHGGLGGDQSHAFLLWPSELSPPTADGTELVGPEHVHQVLRRWLAEAERLAYADRLPAAERLAEPVDESSVTPRVTGAFSTTEPVVQDKSR